MSLRPSRRAVLALAPAVLLTACTDDAPPAPAPVDPDDALVAAAAERERVLLGEYDAVLLALPALAARLLPLRAHHAEHLLALVGPPPSGEPAASPSAGPPAAVPPPATAAAALAGLVAAERAAGQAHGADCLTARSRDLAGLLSTLSASELSHPVALA